MDRERLLDVRDLRVSFITFAGTVQAVRGVSWHLDKKETIAIVGESGCGKTVSIQTVMGLNARKPGCVKEGEILFGGRDLLRCPDREMRGIRGNRISIIFQDPFTFLNPTMSVGDQVTEVYCRHRKASKREALAETLRIMRLISFPSPEENVRRYPHQLSGGMRQRVMIAMALICQPQVLFADEPTTALDVTIQAQIIDLMKNLKRSVDSSIVLITHDMGVVANMADRIYIMYAGEIVEHGSARDIFREPRHPYTKGLLGSVPRLDRRMEGGLYSINGTPPDLIAPPPGCAFAARCGSAMNICRRLSPPRVDFPREQYAACWLHHPAYGERRGGRAAEGVRVG